MMTIPAAVTIGGQQWPVRVNRRLKWSRVHYKPSRQIELRADDVESLRLCIELIERRESADVEPSEH